MLKSWTAKLGQVLVLYGGWGLFALSFLDSSVIPFPVVNDLALIVMASKRPAWWPIYALATTLGSVFGTYVFYGIARSGVRLLRFRRDTDSESIIYVRRWLRGNDFVAILVASLLPPPVPLKLFIFSAGLLRVNPVHFGLALLLGRGLRFAAEAWLGAHYGAQAGDYVRHNLGWASLVTVILVLAVTLLQRWWTKASVRA